MKIKNDGIQVGIISELHLILMEYEFGYEVNEMDKGSFPSGKDT